MAEQESRFAQGGGNQFLQPDSRRRVAADKLRKEGDAGALHMAVHIRGLFGRNIDRSGKVDRLARRAGRQHGNDAVPAVAEHQHSVDVFAVDQIAKPLDVDRFEQRRGRCRPVRHLVKNGRHLEPIREGAQRRMMAVFPSVSQTD